MRRIAILTNFIPTYRQDFYDRLFAAEDNVTVYCQKKGAGRNIKVINDRYGSKVKEVDFLSIRGDRFVWHFLPYWKILRSSDVIVADGNPRHLSQVFLVTIARLIGKKVAIWSSYESRRPGSFESKLRLFWWRIIKYFMTYTEKDVIQLSKAGWKRENMISLNNGLDQSKIKVEKLKWNDIALTNWKVSKGLNGRKIILSSGRVVPRRYDSFLEALPKVIEQFPDLMWVLIGDGEGLPQLKERAAELKITEYIIFEGAVYEEQYIAPWFLSSDLFVYTEGIGLALMHSFGYGIPVLIHDVMHEHGPEGFIFQDGQTGLLYKKNDIQDFVAKIKILLSDKNRLRSMGQKGLEIVQKKHNTEMMVNNFLTLIQIIKPIDAKLTAESLDKFNSSQPKIAIFTNVIPTYRKGFYDRLFENKKSPITVFCQNNAAGSRLDNINKNYPENVVEVPFFSIGGEKFVWHRYQIFKLIKSFDVFVVDGNPRHLSQALLATLAKIFGKKVIVWSTYHSRRNRSFARRIRLLWWRMFGYFLTYTEWDAKRLIESGWDSDLIVAINNGLDQEAIETAKKEWTAKKIETFRRNYELTGRKILITLGRAERGRYELILDALGAIKEDIPEILLVLIGDGEGLESLNEKVASMGLEKHVLFLGAQYEEDKIAPWMMNAEAFIYSKNIGLSLMHAFGYNLPAIIHGDILSHGPEATIFRSNEMGYTFKNGDLNDFISKIKLLLSKPEQSKVFGRNANKVVREKYNTTLMERNFSKMISIVTK